MSWQGGSSGEKRGEGGRGEGGWRLAAEATRLRRRGGAGGSVHLDHGQRVSAVGHAVLRRLCVVRRAHVPAACKEVQHKGDRGLRWGVGVGRVLGGERGWGREKVYGGEERERETGGCVCVCVCEYEAREETVCALKEREETVWR